MAVRVVIGGAIAQQPLGAGGNAWAFLQYVLGLRELGCEVLYVEHVDAGKCIDEEWRPAPFRQSANARYFASIAKRFDLETHASLIERGGDHLGLSHAEITQWAGAADLFINLSGRFHLWDVLRATRRRLYVDLDPGFTQIWQAQYGVDMNLAGHDAYATVGLNLGGEDCPLPTLGITWHTTVPPVVLSEWRTASAPGDAYTTVGDWRGYSPVEWDGSWYGQKAEEFLKVVSLPNRVSTPLELCLAIHRDEPDRLALVENGWRLSDPRERAADPDAYRQFVFGSRGEFSVAKHGYVHGRTGWVSDRTACYLAAGRPAVVQDTGLARHLDVGAGLLVFRDVDGAAAALRAVETDYATHAAAARRLAERVFASRRVLPRLLDIAGV